MPGNTNPPNSQPQPNSPAPARAGAQNQNGKNPVEVARQRLQAVESALNCLVIGREDAEDAAVAEFTAAARRALGA